MKTVQQEASGAEVVVGEKVFSATYRWQHWIRVISIVALIATGFYIAKPLMSPVPSAEPTNFMYGLFRSWHIIFGFLLTAAVLFKSYLFLFGKKHKAERVAALDIFSPKA